MIGKTRIQCAILLAVSCLLACGGKAEAGNVVLTGSAWPPWETAHAMDELGLSPGVTYEFRSYTDSIALFRVGRADALLVNLYDYLALCRDKKIAEETVVILITNHSSGGDMLIARPEITKIADLKGKRVALDVTSISLYMLHLALHKDGLCLSDVERPRVKP
jgi:NitT/TauT family transport system substrate-binding protein